MPKVEIVFKNGDTY
jgi:hypothetical protein